MLLPEQGSGDSPRCQNRMKDCTPGVWVRGHQAQTMPFPQATLQGIPCGPLSCLPCKHFLPVTILSSTSSRTFLKEMVRPVGLPVASTRAPSSGVYAMETPEKVSVCGLDKGSHPSPSLWNLSAGFKFLKASRLTRSPCPGVHSIKPFPCQEQILH